MKVERNHNGLEKTVKDEVRESTRSHVMWEQKRTTEDEEGISKSDLGDEEGRCAEEWIK